MRGWLLLLSLTLAPLAGAQLGVPAVRLPQLPGVGLPNLPGASAELLSGNGLSDLDVRRLQDARSARVRELLRRHRDVLEADPHGAPIVRGELLALAPTPAALAAAVAAGFTVSREQALPALGLNIVVLKAAGATAHSLERLQALDRDGTYDFNHVYLDSGASGTEAAPASAPAGAAASATLGLIDSGVDRRHEVFAGVELRPHGCEGQDIPAEHGTEVASLMVGRSAALHGAASGATLYAADVFCGRPTGGAVDAVADALAWLLEQHVPVINVSLVGPPNRLLERIVHEVIERGCLIVAAVGNDGPAAPPLYPAAWPGVIGVTAVDARARVLVEAGRGKQVKFAAPGADMAAARPGGGYVRVRGTSFAAPIVAGLLALSLRAPDKQAAAQAVAALAGSARHMGTSAEDPVYGYGVVGSELRSQPALTAVH
jgi:subtilisin family serine protease